jgi:hypothetical protein
MKTHNYPNIEITQVNETFFSYIKTRPNRLHHWTYLTDQRTGKLAAFPTLEAALSAANGHRNDHFAD